MDEFTIREATREDKADVLAIQRFVYDGHDYLPVFYDYLLSLENARSFVLLHKDKISGAIITFSDSNKPYLNFHCSRCVRDIEKARFNMACIVDDGFTAISRAARISPEYEGRGLYRYLDNHVTDWIRSKNVSVKAFTATTLNPNVMKPSFQTHNKLIMTQPLYIYEFESEKMLLDDTRAEKLSSIRNVSDSELSTYITSNKISKYLFPSDRIIVNFVPFRLMETNVQFIRDPMKFTEIFSDLRTENDSCSGLLSFGVVYPIEAVPYRYEINIFGADLGSFNAHIIKHLERLKNTSRGCSIVVVVLDDRFPSAMVNSVLQDFGGLKQTHPSVKSQDPYYTMEYLFEKTL